MCIVRTKTDISSHRSLSGENKAKQQEMRIITCFSANRNGSR